MSKLEQLDGTSVADFLAAPAAVLMLGKSDCEACARWTEELEGFLAGDSEWADVRFGKLLLDKAGLIAFKRGNPWVAELDVLPFNVIYKSGEKQSEFAGSGVPRLENRLRMILREG
jgi:hypothetical protein